MKDNRDVVHQMVRAIANLAANGKINNTHVIYICFITLLMHALLHPSNKKKYCNMSHRYMLSCFQCGFFDYLNQYY